MSTPAQREVGAALRLTGVVIGVGAVVSVLLGLVLGALSEDFAGVFGGTVAVAMSVTAVVGVALVLIPGRRGRR
ncbi:hypothetical protein [Motilibacter deserti]|uniref:Major facilitator superfamily (MFS) profile domain-containing protein n=1 Tax=Motilibacter deserti TaxID=2714956 RepID=A0ABX0GV94_9ACTN|nr:hypothetical protein [Motilibacter deserti]NHC14846.1 hypothetical protein [Motilibacter deserti]